MVDGIRNSSSEHRLGAARRRTDPLLKAIAFDLLVTTGGFMLIVAAVVLAAQGLSLN
jgi:hypothetical protein